MIDPNMISAVVVTKGDRDITRVVESLACFGEVIVHNNSRGARDSRQSAPDLKVYGRYDAAFRHAKPGNLIYVQDDDCRIDALAMLPYFEPGKVLCNMTPQHAASPYYQWRIKLVGFGAIFDRTAIAVFDQYFEGRKRVTSKYENALTDPLFLIECDRIFTALNECVECQIPVEHLEYSSDNDRLWKQPDHRARMLEVERRLRGMIE